MDLLASDEEIPYTADLRPVLDRQRAIATTAATTSTTAPTIATQPRSNHRSRTILTFTLTLRHLCSTLQVSHSFPLHQ